MTTAPGLRRALAETERDVGCRVLAARDTGSRSRGLAGPDSDHDVQVVYVQPSVRYVTLAGYVESVEPATEPPLELSGWNVRRFAELLSSSNPAAVAFLTSPVRHRTYEPLAALETAVAEGVDPVGLYHHYRSLARNQYRKYLQRTLLDGDDPVWVIEDEDADGYTVRPYDPDGNGAKGGGGGDAENGDADAPGGDTPTPATERLSKPTRYRESTVDRSVKRTLHVLRAGLAARYVLAHHAPSPASFAALVDAAATLPTPSAAEAGAAVGEQTPEDPPGARGVDREWVAAARRLAERKRAGEGSATVTGVVGPAIVPPERVDYAAHGGDGPEVAAIDRFLERAVADAPRGTTTDATDAPDTTHPTDGRQQ